MQPFPQFIGCERIGEANLLWRSSCKNSLSLSALQLTAAACGDHPSEERAMPNTGMLDHRAFRPKAHQQSYVYFMGAWPSKAGYQTVRSRMRISQFSRHLRSNTQIPTAVSRPASSTPRLAMGNSVSPFHTAMKPSCGYFFSRVTDNRKRNIGIPPSDLVSWRSHGSYSAPSRARTAA